MINTNKESNTATLIEKRKVLAEKYNLWLKRNKLRFFISIIFYIFIIMLNFFVIKNNKLYIGTTLLMFAYSIYIYTIHWYTNKHLLGTLDKKTDI